MKSYYNLIAKAIDCDHVIRNKSRYICTPFIVDKDPVISKQKLIVRGTMDEGRAGIHWFKGNPT